MADATPPVSNQSEITPATDVTGKTGPAATNEEVSAATSFANVNQLKEQAPTVWKAMMESYAWHICNESRKHQKRIKQILRDKG